MIVQPGFVKLETSVSWVAFKAPVSLWKVRGFLIFGSPKYAPDVTAPTEYVLDMKIANLKQD